MRADGVTRARRTARITDNADIFLDHVGHLMFSFLLGIAVRVGKGNYPVPLVDTDGFHSTLVQLTISLYHDGIVLVNRNSEN
jgi:hypothetical protein